MLFAITKKSEIKEANNLLFGKLASLKHESYVINYGSAGGSTLIQIYGGATQWNQTGSGTRLV
jgi:hypothetical protein